MSKSRHPQIPAQFAGLVDPRLQGARCAGRAPMFDDDLPGENPETRSARLADAARICRGCPVLSACRTAAHEQDHPTGIWAGTDFTVDRKNRGRPRKDRSA
ncbi:WhiB family transcriptional regulator [Rhodococcus aetherivorans]|uniref:WhiB family transcriptional regulator n=1 Tax=Rhodococcus aetherivorans TaxID=191292 RepID=UPI002948E479|nr:WhiB family transcriptional regulator [Rhodococcus aetherivorans]MDV6292246.1 WhiB family transcriptional regulator [Rhodococcus aetherivorans]